MTPTRSGSRTSYPRPMSAGGALLRVGMGRTSPSDTTMTTPPMVGTVPNRSRDVRAAVCAIVARLTIKLLDVGAGVESKDAYVANARRDIKRGKSAAVQQIAAIAYDDLWNKGRSAAEVQQWLLELCEEIGAWEQERDGQRIAPPDVLPLLRVETRKEGAENEAALRLAANPECPEAMQGYIDAAEPEVAAQVDAINGVRKSLVRRLRSLAGAR